MMRFTTKDSIPVREPFRLDLTVDALRRLASNTVDVVAADGAYLRAFPAEKAPVLVRVRKRAPASIEVETNAPSAEPYLERVGTMLGIAVDLGEWEKRTKAIPWLDRLSVAFRGVKPPRYPTLWEACTHAIVFQQISIHAAASIMRRLVDALGEQIECDGERMTTFPTPRALLDAREAVLIEAGLSTNKRAHLRTVAAAIEAGEIAHAEIERLSTSKAMERLVTIRGIGPWSAAVVLLRGFGRLDIFPMRDSGVARRVKELSGDPEVDLDDVLGTLGPVRGMLYYHLLLGGLRNLVARSAD